MENIDLKDFHHRLCLLMNEIHKICIENGIDYTMMGGTLLGALRHKGFIPWDDDMDIGMTYENYIKFINIAFSLNHEWIEFDLAGITKAYYCPYIKAYDSRTTFKEGDRDIPKGIFIDIFPIVHAGNTKIGAYLSFKKHRFLQAILKRKAYHYETGYGREWVMKSLSHLFSIKSLMSQINNQYKKLSQNRTFWSSDMDGTLNGIVPTELFDNYILYVFENYEFMGIQDADKYMTLVFGDYMKLPPIEKRIPHHVDIIDLQTPYKEYK